MLKYLSFKVKIGKTSVKIVQRYKYLGVLIDNNLGLRDSIKMVKSKLLKVFFTKQDFFKLYSVYLSLENKSIYILGFSKFFVRNFYELK